MDIIKAILIGSIKNLAQTGIAIADTRLRLLALDVQETGLTLLSLLILSGLTLICAGMALVFGTLTVVIFFWDTHRMLALCGATGFFFIVALGLWLTVLRWFRGSQPLFSSTRAEFIKDREWLSRNSRNPT